MFRVISSLLAGACFMGASLMTPPDKMAPLFLSAFGGVLTGAVVFAKFETDKV